MLFYKIKIVNENIELHQQRSRVIIPQLKVGLFLFSNNLQGGGDPRTRYHNAADAAFIEKLTAWLPSLRGPHVKKKIW